MAVPRITKEELKARLDAADEAARPVLVDARLKYPYEHSTATLPGAVRLAPGAGPDDVKVPAGREIVVYDSDLDEIVGAPVAASFIDRGFKAAVLKGGIAEWMAASLPTDTKTAPKLAAAAGSAKA